MKVIKKLFTTLLFLIICSSAFATTYYVRPSSGSDGNAGTSTGAAWATLGKATSTVVAGDLVYVQSEADFTETMTISTAGGFGSPIIWEGYNTTPGDDPTGADRWTIAGTGTNNLSTSTIDWNVFKNIVLKNASDDCLTGGSGSDNNTFINFRFTNCSGDGSGGTDNGDIYIDGEIDNTTGRGINRNSNSTVRINSVYIHDTGDDCYFGDSSNDNVYVYDSICDTATGSGFEIDGKIWRAIGNIVYNASGASSDGFRMGNTGQNTPMLYYNNISIDNGRYGFNGGMGSVPFFDYNLYSGNGTSGLNGFTAGSNDVTTDPSFTAKASGDFTLSSGSTAENAGFPQTVNGATGDYNLNIGIDQSKPSAVCESTTTCTTFFN